MAKVLANSFERSWISIYVFKVLLPKKNSVFLQTISRMLSALTAV